LPPLERKRASVVGGLFILLTTLALLLTIGGTIFNAIDQFRNIPDDGAYGFRTGTTETGGNMIAFASSSAKREGLKDQDRIEDINGHPLSSASTEDDVGALAQQSGSEVRLLVRSGNGPLRQVTLQHIPRSVWTSANLLDGMPVWLSAILNFLTHAAASWVLLAAALLLFLRRGHDRGAMAFAFAFSLMAIDPGGAFWLSYYHLPSVFVFLLPFALYATGVSLFGVAVAGFPDGLFRTLPTRLVPVLAGLGLAVDWIVVFVQPSPITPPAWVATALAISSACTASSIFVAFVAQLIRYLRAPLENLERQQFKWVILSFAIAAIAMVVAQTIYRSGAANLHSGVLSATFLLAALVLQLAPPIGVLVSLVRYRLYDAEAAITRSVAYGALTLALLAIFAGSERMLELVGEEYLGHSVGLLAGGLGAGIAAVMIAPIHKRASNWAERRFQKDLLELRRGLPLLIADIRETASVEELADAVLTRVMMGVRAAHGAMVIGDMLLQTRHVAHSTAAAWMRKWTPAGGENLDCAKEDPIFPMRVPLRSDAIGRVGWLLLGPRPDGSFYGKDEREALLEIAAPVARAIAVAQQRQARRDEQKAVTTTFARRLTLIEEELARLVGSTRASTT